MSCLKTTINCICIRKSKESQSSIYQIYVTYVKHIQRQRQIAFLLYPDHSWRNCYFRIVIIDVVHNYNCFAMDSPCLVVAFVGDNLWRNHLTSYRIISITSLTLNGNISCCNASRLIGVTDILPLLPSIEIKLLSVFKFVFFYIL